MTDAQYDQIQDAIKGRSTFETRMETWYKARFTGIPRANKPYQGAPDMRYPLIDTIIEKLRPFYAQQIYSDLVLATFVCDNSLAREQIVNAEQWFDYKLKQQSNFEPSMMKAIDYMLVYGFCPVKVYWHAKKQQVCYDPVDPIYAIVPEWTEEDPDFFVHVLRMSKAQYKADPNYKQGDSFIDSIAGSGNYSTNSGQSKEQTKATREGITYCSDKNQIVLWECYLKEGDKWVVETISPVRGSDGGTVREPYGLPYAHGQLPFVVFRHDNSQKGWYASRGISEILALHQQALNKNWNSQLQFLDFFGHPMFENKGLTPINPGNFQGKPGMILPSGVSPVGAVSAPLDFQQQMQFVRALAEDRIVIPDLSSGEHLVGPKSVSGKITATQVNAIVGLTNQSNDLRSRMFRMQLAQAYLQSWELLKQFAGEQLGYIFENSQNQLDPMLLQQNYNIVPSGSADSWNKQQRMQDAVQVYSQMQGNPNIDQLELTKWYFEARDPRLNNRLVRDAGLQAKKQAERQAVETTVMLQGRPMSVDPSDDDMAHVQDIQGSLQRRMQTGETITPEFSNLMLTHANDHANQMKSKKHPMANQVAKQVAQAAKMFQQAAQMQQQGMGQPQGQPGQMAQPGGPQGQPPDPVDPRPAWTPVDYKTAVPSIKRQIEAKAGFVPATPEETALEVTERVQKASPKQPAGKPGQAGQQPGMSPQGGMPGDVMQGNGMSPDGMSYMGGGPQPKQGRGTMVQAPAITLHIPEIKIPEIKIPKIEVPKVDMSKVKFPQPIVNVAAPIVNVPAPVVHVEAPKQPKVEVDVDVPKVTKVNLIRDKSGKATGATVEHEK